MGTGKSRYESALSLGLKFEMIPTKDGGIKSAVPALSVEDGIDAVRRRLSVLYIDKEKCSKAIKALKHYQKDFDEKNKVYRNNPKHDWSSHCADMIRYWAITDVMDNSKQDALRRAEISQIRHRLLTDHSI